MVKRPARPAKPRSAVETPPERLARLEETLRLIANPPKEVRYSGDYARWAMEFAGAAVFSPSGEKR